MIRFRRLLPCSLALVTALAATHSASAQNQTVCYTDSIVLQSTNWNHSVTVPKFDPALGDLQQIKFTLGGHIEGAARIENGDATAQTVNTNFQATLTLTRPDLSVIVVTIPIATFMDTLAAFDGTIDFMGPSGVSHNNIMANNSNMATSPPPPSDLVLFTGLPNNPGTITLPVTAAGTSNAMGPGNVTTQFVTMASATCEVCYTYAPNHPPTFSAPNCGATLMASVGVPISFQVCASDSDPMEVVTLTSGPLPPGAGMSPPLPDFGNPVCSTFTWTCLNTDVGPHLITFTATDGHLRTATCSVTVMCAECHLLLSAGTGHTQVPIFGHLYDTQLTSIRHTWPVTMANIPNFPYPHSHGINGLDYSPLPFYAQVVMYNPQVFPNNPSQWSKAMRVSPMPDGNPVTDYFGTANGIGIRAIAYTDPSTGQLRLKFPFVVWGM